MVTELKELTLTNSGIEPNAENINKGTKLSSRLQQMVINSKEDVSDKSLYKRFLQEQRDKEKNEKRELLEKFDDILAMNLPIIKVTDFHHVLDMYDSFTQFEWHTKRDDSRILRSLVNGEGCFIVTSKKKVYMGMRHRIEFNRFLKDPQTKKWEVPKLCLNAPKGTSLFQTPSELKYSLENKEKIEHKYNSMVEALIKKHNKKPVTPCSNHTKLCPKILITEPKPKKDTYFC